MGFLDRKYKTPQHYKPISKDGQKALFYGTLAIILGTLLYILSFYIL